MGKPVQWRAPDDVRQWLERQPAGISGTLERLVRDAMDDVVVRHELEQSVQALTLRIVELEARLDEARRFAGAAKPAPVAPAEDDGWGDFGGDN